VGCWGALRGSVGVAGEMARAARQFEVDLAAAIEAGHFVRLHKSKNGWSSTTEVDETVYGYLKGDLVLIKSKIWHRLCAGRDELAKHLCQIGKLIPDNAGKTSRKERVLGRDDRYYVWNTGTPEHDES
jgi:hypothetical protein